MKASCRFVEIDALLLEKFWSRVGLTMVRKKNTLGSFETSARHSSAINVGEECTSVFANCEINWP
jgi:hypothetical protein